MGRMSNRHLVFIEKAVGIHLMQEGDGAYGTGAGLCAVQQKKAG